MTEDEFTGAKPPCDLVLQGGAVSDLVYPSAIVGLAKNYRFSSVGGTSAGALAACIAAAGEYARDKGGFQRVALIPHQVAATLFDQFQPEPKLKPLFNMVTAPMGKKGGFAKSLAVVLAAVRGYLGRIFAGALPGLLIFVFALAARSYGWLSFGLLLALVGAIVVLVFSLVRVVTEELPTANFGMCSGKTLPDGRGPAITDWLADTIDRVAGRVDGEGRLGLPLTFGDLKAHRPPIELAMVTTDLSMKRPYHLPFRDPERVEHFFSRADFGKLFSDRVMDQMCGNRQPLPVLQGWTDCPADLFSFPNANDLPIVVAARLSLSLPGVIQTVPVYKRDLTLRRGSDQPRKCIFSDGGLTSNFPIHFFDRMWPNSPTFAISFDDYSDARHHDGTKEIRVEMARDLREGEFLPILPIDGLIGFVSRLLEAAREWQDNLQSVLPGYRERIVHVHLKPEEGGFNLKMPSEIIDRLVAFGEKAGALPASPAFNMDEHRWRRFLVSMAEMEHTLGEIVEAFEKQPVFGGNFGEFLSRYGYNGVYPAKDANWKQEIMRRADELVALGKRWKDQPTVNSGNIPNPRCDLRLVPKH